MNNDFPISGFQFTNAGSSAPDQPKIVLVGSAMRFSERMLEVFRSEFPDFSFVRLNLLSDLIATSQSIGEMGLVVIEEQHTSCLLKDPASYTNAIGSAQIVIGYNNIKNAGQFLSDRPATGEFDNVGFLPLNAQMDVWLAVMRLLLSGHAFIPQELVNEMRAERSQPDDVPVAAITLTPREWQVLELVAEGVQNKNIAADLDLSVHTVKLHIHNLLNKIGVSNRTCAASWYMQGHRRGATGQHVSNA